MKSLLKPLPQDTFIFHAGTSVNDQGKIVTSGGRVIASTAIAETLRQSVDKAYVGVNEHVSFNKNTIEKILLIVPSVMPTKLLVLVLVLVLVSLMLMLVSLLIMVIY